MEETGLTCENHRPAAIHLSWQSVLLIEKIELTGEIKQTCSNSLTNFIM
jgi:hypothetical protein